MITEALLHLPGIGPARVERLRKEGVLAWSDLLARPHLVPARFRAEVLRECERCIAALEAEDIAYLVERFAPKDRWRILLRFLEETSFFDIETAGLELDDPITVIVCWHRGAVHTFVEHENLDDFLALLPDVRLLSSFNGGSFDVPRVVDAFHIPGLPCPHLDLRWLCYHQGLRGGLKDISIRLGITRPDDLQCADGELAIRLWARWHHFDDRPAREELIRYCASDVLLLVELAQQLVDKRPLTKDAIWQQLPGVPSETPSAPQGETTVLEEGAFGDASPARLRGRRRLAG